MRSRLPFVAAAILLCAHPAGAEEIKSANITVNVSLATRTSLTVSSHTLHFDVAQPGGIATAALEFIAGARMPAGSDVVLSVEPMHAIEGPGGAADVESHLSFTGDGQGLLAGPIAAAQSTVVGRWQGSGRREGRVLFTLRANAPGTYSLPLRVVLSTP